MNTLARTILTELLHSMGMSDVVITERTAPVLDSVVLVCDLDLPPAISSEVIHSLQHLLRDLIAARTDESAPDTTTLLDINGTLSKRIAELERIAAVLASRVTAFNTAVHADPMNALDRKILHTLLQQHTHLTTESEGEGYERHIVARPIQA